MDDFQMARIFADMIERKAMPLGPRQVRRKSRGSAWEGVFGNIREVIGLEEVPSQPWEEEEWILV